MFTFRLSADKFLIQEIAIKKNNIWLLPNTTLGNQAEEVDFLAMYLSKKWQAKAGPKGCHVLLQFNKDIDSGLLKCLLDDVIGYQSSTLRLQSISTMRSTNMIWDYFRKFMRISKWYSPDTNIKFINNNQIEDILIQFSQHLKNPENNCVGNLNTTFNAPVSYNLISQGLLPFNCTAITGEHVQRSQQLASEVASQTESNHLAMHMGGIAILGGIIFWAFRDRTRKMSYNSENQTQAQYEEQKSIASLTPQI